jgi:hypothetical protein
MTSLEPTYAQLKIMYPAYYQRQIDIQNYYNEPDPDVNIERNLRTMYFNDPVPLPKEPTYAQLKIMYPAYYQRQVDIQNYYNEPDPDVKIERNLRTMYSNDPVPLPKEPADSIGGYEPADSIGGYEPADGYDPLPVPILPTVPKENTSYMMPILIAVLLIILFIIFKLIY